MSACPGCYRHFKSKLGLRKHLLQTTQSECRALLISSSKLTANADTTGTTEPKSELEDGKPVHSRSLLISTHLILTIQLRITYYFRNGCRRGQ